MRRFVVMLALVAATRVPASGGEVSTGVESPTYFGGYDGFGRFGDDHGIRGFGADMSFRGQGRSWSSRDTAVESGTIGLGYGLSMGPYQGSFTESFGYPDGGGRLPAPGFVLPAR